jgi:hypothetical protein
MSWLDIVPSFMSAVASLAAAVAAFVSLRISKQSISVAEHSALAVHHSSASLEYSKIVNSLCEATKDYSKLSYRVWANWAREIEQKDNYELGGVDPRPLRHVLSNGSEMLANYGSNYNSFGRSAERSILSVIRNGVAGLNEAEYQKLLKKADGSYIDCEGVLGIPSKSESITSAPAFRWICHQINKRVRSEDWINIWKNTWLEGGYLNDYKIEYVKIKPVLNSARDSLKAEKAKLAHSVFPLESNFELSKKYSEIIRILDELIDGCNSEALDVYQDWNYKEELGQLVVCSMAIAYLVMNQLDLIYMSRDE